VGVGASKLKLGDSQGIEGRRLYRFVQRRDGRCEEARCPSNSSITTGRPVIDRIERISRPGLRIYRGKDELPRVLGRPSAWRWFSTPQGIMSDKQARAAGTGGEVLFVVQ